MAKSRAVTKPAKKKSAARAKSKPAPKRKTLKPPKTPKASAPVASTAPASKSAAEAPATVRAPHLSRGRQLGLIAPSFSFDSTLMEAGRGFLESKYGLKTGLLPSIREQEAYFAGSDERRLDELFHWLTEPHSQGLLAVRGGYGCARIYPQLIERLKKHRHLKPKAVIGYSDLTILLNGLYQDLGWITFHGPVLVGRPFRAPVPIEESTFHKALFTTEPLGAISDAQMSVLNAGQATAPIVGGCLSLLASSLGTSYEIRTDGKILFLEEVDEKPYRLDRMLTQLVHAGKFDRIAGLVIGELVGCEPGEGSRDPSKTSARGAVELALLKLLKDRGIPAVMGFPAGHGMPQITFPIGALVELKAIPDAPEVIFRESGVR